MAAGTIGAVLTVGVISLVHGLQPQVVEKRFEPTVSSALTQGLAGGSERDDVVEIAQDMGAAVARLETQSPNGDVTGSAVLVRDGAYLLTNAELVEGATRVRIFTVDGKERDATVVGADPVTDVAVLKVAATGLATAKIGSTTSLRVGQKAIAIGAPAASGNGPSVTVGVVSGLGRRVSGAAGTLHGMIETDARIAPESAGGALVDSAGQVIGITTLLDGSVLALGAATPIEVAMAAADDIIRTGRAHHSWLGIEGDDLDEESAASLNISGGARVGTVVDQSPAALAGLLPGDIIVAIDGTDVTSMSDLVVTLRTHKAGDNVKVHYLRTGHPAMATVTLAEK
jgi:S1-C subfamily serine protease